MSLDHCRVISLNSKRDHRGSLTIVEGQEDIPFVIQRVYFLHDVPEGAIRGGHAHKTLQQFIIAASGSFDLLFSDGKNTKQFHLNSTTQGVYVPPMLWRDIKNFSAGSVCMVLASHSYSEDDYYRNFSEFQEAAAK